MTTPIVFITGDCHHYLGDHPIQRQEAVFSEQWARILADFGLNGTLFVTGKCVLDSRTLWNRIIDQGNVEIGGHTYNALRDVVGKMLKMLWRKFGLELYPLSSCYWDREVELSLAAFRTLGVKPVSWRTHAYLSQRSLYKVLRRRGFKVVSNYVAPGSTINIFETDGLVHVPVNVMTDDEVFELFIRRKDPSFVGKRLYCAISEAIERRQHLCVQLHPVCMKILDDFQIFEEIAKAISNARYASLKLDSNVDGTLRL